MHKMQDVVKVKSKHKGNYKGKRNYSLELVIYNPLLRAAEFKEGDAFAKVDPFTHAITIIQSTDQSKPPFSYEMSRDIGNCIIKQKAIIKAEFSEKRELEQHDFKILKDMIRTKEGINKNRQLWDEYRNWLWFNKNMAWYLWTVRSKESVAKDEHLRNKTLRDLVIRRANIIQSFPVLEYHTAIEDLRKRRPETIKELDELNKQIEELKLSDKGTKPKEGTDAHPDSPKNTTLTKEDVEQLGEIKKKKAETEET